MERLTNTLFFRTLLRQDGTSANREDDLNGAYKEFVLLLVQTSLDATKGIPAYFILNYTHAELSSLQHEIEREEKKKCTYGEVPFQSAAPC